MDKQHGKKQNHGEHNHYDLEPLQTDGGMQNRVSQYHGKINRHRQQTEQKSSDRWDREVRDL